MFISNVLCYFIMDLKKYLVEDILTDYGSIIQISDLSIISKILILASISVSTFFLATYTPKIKKIISEKEYFKYVAASLCILLLLTPISVYFDLSYSEDAPNDHLVIAISPFSYAAVEDKDIKGFSDEIKERIESNANNDIEIKLLKKPVHDKIQAATEGEKNGAHLIIYGSSKKFDTGNREEMHYNILLLPSFHKLIKYNVSVNLNEKSQYSLASNESVVIIESMKDNISSVVSLVNGLNAYSKNNYDEAIYSLKLVNDYENNDYVLFYIANSYFSTENYTLSLEYFSKSLNLNEQSVSGWNNKGLSLSALGRYDEAIKTYDTSLHILNKSNNRIWLIWYNYGIELSRIGEYDEAINAFNETLKINSENWHAWDEKGRAYDSLGKYDEALDAYNQVLNITQNDSEVWNNIGLELFSLGRYTESINALNNSLELNVNNGNAWNNKGLVLHFFGRYDEALVSYGQALNITPDQSGFLSNMGVTFRALGRYDEALIVYNQALNITQNDSEILTKKGHVLRDMGEFEEAVDVYNKSLDINPYDAVTLYFLGVSFESIGKYDDAINAYNKSLEMNISDPDILNNIGFKFQSFNKYEESLVAYNRAIANGMRDEKIWNNKGTVLCALDRYDEGIDAYNESLRINQGYASAWYNKGLALHIIGNTNESNYAYNRAIEINPKIIT